MGPMLILHEGKVLKKFYNEEKFYKYFSSYIADTDIDSLDINFG